jgi:hypothetical protein
MASTRRWLATATEVDESMARRPRPLTPVKIQPKEVSLRQLARLNTPQTGARPR